MPLETVTNVRTIDKLSKILDDTLLESRIILRGTIILMGLAENVDKVVEHIRSKCMEACLIKLELDSTRAEMYMVRGQIIAIKISRDNRTFYGSEALSMIREIASRNVRAIVYAFSLDLFGSYLEEIRSVMEIAEAPKIAESVKPRDIHQAIAEDLKSLGIEVSDVVIDDRPDRVAVVVRIPSSARIPSVEELFISVAGDTFMFMDVDKDVDISIEWKKVFRRRFDHRLKNVWKALALIPKVLTKYYLHVDKVNFSLRDRSLHVFIMLKREDVYPSVGLSDIAREIYEKIRNIWGGDVKVVVQIGMLGLRAEAP